MFGNDLKISKKKKKKKIILWLGMLSKGVK
jgi:hypothetical protein